MLSPIFGGSENFGDATFLTRNDVVWASGTVSSSVSVTTPAGPVPCPVAMFSTDPASRSACVRAYDPVQLIDSPGANDTAGGGFGVQSNVGTNVSLTVTSSTVTFPSLVTSTV